MIYKRKSDGTLWVKTETTFPPDGYNFTRVNKTDNLSADRWLCTDKLEFERVK